MRSRALKFKLLCGLEGCIPLDPTDLSEVSSAEEFITIIDKFRVGIRKFNDRNPTIMWHPSSSLKEDTTLNDVIHEIVNSRKFMNFPNVNEQDYWQVFKLDFTTETITFYKASDITEVCLTELGSMHINTMFSNWKDIFYSLADFYITPFDDDDSTEIETVDEEESLYSFRSRQMIEQLDEKEYELWDFIQTAPNKEGEYILDSQHVKITYSGGGDSGDIDTIVIDTPTSDARINFLDVYDRKTFDELCRMIWRVIDEKEGGFYNNDGGYGNMNVGVNKFEWEHFNYYQSEEAGASVYVKLEDKLTDEFDLPTDIVDAMSASVPETKPETTLLDIVGEHSETVKVLLKELEDIGKAGSDFDFDQVPPDTSF